MRVGMRDSIFGAVMLVVAALLWLETSRDVYSEGGVLGYGFNPAFFPRILIILWSVTAIILILRSVPLWQIRVDKPLWGSAAASIALTGLYVFLMGQIGFLFSSMLFMALLIPLMGYRRVVVVLPVAIIFPVVVWYIFNFLLYIPLPTSPWFVRM